MGLFDKIFSSGSTSIKWYKVFGSQEEADKNIPLNRAVTVQIEGKKICLARTTEGYFAVDDVCPHLGASLSRGVCNNYGEVICPWHSYRFNLVTGHETSGQASGTGVEVYKTEIRKEGGLYIGI